MRRPVLLMLVMAWILAVAADLATAGPNLVDNPSFAKKKAGERIHRWSISTREGRTRFEVVDGVLTAERSARTGILPDSCYQYVNLPADAAALRLAVKAGTTEARGVEVALRFKTGDGGPIGSVTVFRLSGTRAARKMERDVLVPANARDVEVAFILSGAGKATFDEVSLTVVDAKDIREDARVFTVTGEAAVKWTGTRPEEPLRVFLPVPPAAGSQTPIRLEVKTSPPGRITVAAFDVNHGTGFLKLILDPLDRPGNVRIKWKATVVVYERPAYRGLPDALPTGGRRPRKLEPFLVVEAGPGLAGFAPRLDLGKGDLRSLAERAALVLSRRVTGTPDGPVDPEAVAGAKRGTLLGQANLTAALFRMHGVPARVSAVLRTDESRVLEHVVEAWHVDHGWLRFGTTTVCPHPLPFAGAVTIGTAGATGWPDPLAPETPAGIEGHAAPHSEFRLTPIGTFSLPKGSVDDFASSAGKSWEKALRRLRIDDGVVTALMAKPELKGKAKGATDDLEGFLGK